MRAFLAGALLLSALVPAQDPQPQDPNVDPDWHDPAKDMASDGPKIGKELYDRYCVNCHGVAGDGKGDLAGDLDPPPRDFTRPEFKCRTTPPDSLPMLMDLMEAVNHGSPLSSMLSYSFLTSQQSRAVVDYLKTFCKTPRWDPVKAAVVSDDAFPATGHGLPLKGGLGPKEGLPKADAKTLELGKKLFSDLKCTDCHGEDGDGNGHKAQDLVDDTVDPPRRFHPRDFTQGIYSGGPNARHLYFRISLGVQGTPMPSFLTATIEERWALAHYVISLSKRKSPPPLPHTEILEADKARVLPADPWAQAWAALDGIPPRMVEVAMVGVKSSHRIELYAQQLKMIPGRPYFEAADVRAFHDGRSLAVLVEWEDAAADAGTDDKPADQMEIQWAAGGTPGFVLHGGPKEPANLWRWSAKDPEKAVELDAKGPFDEEIQAAGDQGVKATASWKDGKWRVLFIRTFTASGPDDVPLAVGPFIPFLVHFWDGKYGDKEFQLRTTTSHRLLMNP